MTWLDYLEGLVTEVANGRAGQAGGVTVQPPDDRIDAQLRARPGAITVEGGGTVTNYRPGQAREAISAYAAAVEGGA
jgi:hypothetical protein